MKCVLGYICLDHGSVNGAAVSGRLLERLRLLSDYSVLNTAARLQCV